MDKLYLVTGANGFVGNNVVRALISKNLNVLAFVRNGEKFKRVLSAPYFQGEITDENLVAATGEYTDVCVIHCAGIVNIGKDKDGKMKEANYHKTKTVADFCLKRGFKLVYISSVHAFKEQKSGVIYEPIGFDPNEVKDDYAKSKAAASAYVCELMEKGLQAALLLPSGIVGPYDYSDSYLTSVITQFKKGKIPAAVSGGYSFVDVRDVAEAAVSASDAQSGIYLTAGNFVSVKELLDCIADSLGKKRVKHVFPTALAYLGIPFFALSAALHKQKPLFTAVSLKTLSSNGNFSNEKAERCLSFNARPISQTVKDCVEFLKSEGKL